MRVVRWPGGESPCPHPSAATLGVFDGVHRGHVRVIESVRVEANTHSWRSAIVTFDRHPGAIVRNAPQPAITSLEHKLRLFDSLGMDLCVVVGFDDEVARLSAESFAGRVFGELLDVRLLVLGEDCRFGRGREGDVAACRRFGEEMGYDVVVIPPVAVGGERVSSTAIRQAVLAGEFARAAELLGRPFSLYGTVVRGDGRGRSLGFATANIDPHNETIPPDGVYAGWGVFDQEVVRAVVSVGRRATFGRETDGKRTVEAHLMGWTGDLYGRSMEVQFVRLLRDQRAFAGPGELAAQIARDLEDACTILAESGPGPG